MPVIPIESRRKQTKAPQFVGMFSLPVSPYFRLSNDMKQVTGRDTKISIVKMKFVITNLGPNECDFNKYSGSTPVGNDAVSLSVSEPASNDVLISAATTALLQYVSDNSLSMTAADFLFPTAHATPTSYQTIVSQTGTSAPAVSGGFTPTNTYAGTPTFTWARTGTGVYTLTASSAIFSTSKTGVFVAPLQNLNGSIRAVVTSTTVITVTTAVQSLAVLGLLGFTVTNTDALLNGTMIYVQTYA